MRSYQIGKSRIGKAILAHLLAYPHAATTAELIEAVYGCSAHEPHWSRGSVQAVLHRLKHQYLPQTYPFLALIFRDGRYRLVLKKPAP